MLQSRLIFDNLFDRGISPKKGKNLNFFSEVVNLKPTEEGFVGVDKGNFSFLVNNEGEEVFNIGLNSFLFTPSKIYRIESDNSLTLEMEDIEIGGRWTVADFQQYAIFSNGKRNIILDIDRNFKYINDIPVCKSLVNFNGQLVIGGLTLDINNFIPSCVPSLQEALSFIAYSSISTLNIIPSAEVTDAGYMSLNEIGEVFGVTTLDNEVVVLGSGGVVILSPVEHFFGKVGISPFGVRDEWSWGVSDSGVFFIDKHGSLWMVEKGRKVTLLGYSYLFVNTPVRFFKHGRELFLRSSSKTYVLNSKGLYSLNGVFKGSIGNRGEDKFLVSSLPSLNDCSLITSVFDFKDSGMKILEEIDLGIESGTEDLEFRIHTHGEMQKPWFQTQWFRLNKDNSCKPHIAGVEFKIEFKVPSYSEINISWLELQYVKIDKRINRGHSFVDVNKEG